LNADALKVWNEVVVELSAMGILSKSDGRALGRYCDALVRWRKAAKFIDEHGDMYALKDANGQPKCFQQYPQVSLYHKLGLMLLRLEQEFGLTPSARARFTAPMANSEINDVEREFFGGDLRLAT